MNHKAAAKAHVRTRMIERYGRAPSLRDMDNIRLALKTGNCFLVEDCGATIRGIVQFENIHISAVYNKVLNGLVTVGCPLTGRRG